MSNDAIFQSVMALGKRCKSASISGVITAPWSSFTAFPLHLREDGFIDLKFECSTPHQFVQPEPPVGLKKRYPKERRTTASGAAEVD